MNGGLRRPESPAGNRLLGPAHHVVARATTVVLQVTIETQMRDIARFGQGKRSVRPGYLVSAPGGCL